MLNKMNFKMAMCSSAAAVVILALIQAIQFIGIHGNSVLDVPNEFQKPSENGTTVASRSSPIFAEDPDDIKIQAIVDRLLDKKSIIPYYMYDDPEIEQPQMIRFALGERKFHTWGYFTSEAQILSNLKSHPWKTKNVTEAMLYIIPFSTAAALLTPGEHARQHVKKAFQALYNTSIFQSTMGHKHLLFSLAIPAFATWWRHRSYPIELTGLTEEYTKLVNVTIANDLDFEAVFEYQKTLPVKYQYIVNRTHPITRYSFSMNLQSFTLLPIINASIEKFYSSSNHICYYTMRKYYHNNATQIRNAPLHATIPPVNTTNKNGYQKYNTNDNITYTGVVSSIGVRVPEEEWIQKYTNSQFCLSVRGDSPHSRSFLRAIKVGCIPVIIAQTPYFAPIFKHLIPLDKYAIIIDDEDKFIENPTRELLKLRDIPEEVITSKIKWLAFAQRLFFLDHPKSLFIEALLIEANISSTIDLH